MHVCAYVSVYIFMNIWFCICIYIRLSILRCRKIQFITAFLSSRFLPQGYAKEDNTTYHLELTSQKSNDSTWSLVLPSPPYIPAAMEQYHHLLLWNKTEGNFINWIERWRIRVPSGNKEESIKTSKTLKGMVDSVLTLNSDVAWILRILHHESYWFLAIPRYTLKHQEKSEFQYLHANQAIHVQIWAFITFYSFLIAFWKFQSLGQGENSVLSSWGGHSAWKMNSTEGTAEANGSTVHSPQLFIQNCSCNKAYHKQGTCTLQVAHLHTRGATDFMSDLRHC